MYAALKTARTQPVESERLNSSVKKGAKTSMMDLSVWVGSGSRAQLLSGSTRTAATTSSMVTAFFLQPTQEICLPLFYCPNVADWMRSNCLQLNVAMTEIIWCATSRRLHQLSQTPLPVCTDFETLSAAVRDLEIHLDSDMSMSPHVKETVSTCFTVLR